MRSWLRWLRWWLVGRLRRRRRGLRRIRRRLLAVDARWLGLGLLLSEYGPPRPGAGWWPDVDRHLRRGSTDSALIGARHANPVATMPKQICGSYRMAASLSRVIATRLVLPKVSKPIRC